MTNTIRLVVKPARQIRTVVRGIGLPGPPGEVPNLLSAICAQRDISTGIDRIQRVRGAFGILDRDTETEVWSDYATYDASDVNFTADSTLLTVDAAAYNASDSYFTADSTILTMDAT